MFTQAQAGKAKHAVEFYTSLFPASNIHAMVHYEPGDGDALENIKHASFSLGSTLFKAMDSSHAHQFTFSEGISLVVECDTQAEIDTYWKALTKNGEEQMCGWLKDQFGVSWQIVPAILGELMSNPKRSQRVANAFMQMKKMDIKKLMDA
jgi:predicted 3-demethylubiquinone-9 3-methyltransferase (glyoxalase superfamily)